jgi:F-type H+-transporting ATPase subunit delta
MKRIASRYAQALVQIAIEMDHVALFEQQLKTCADIIHSNQTIYAILINPENSFKVKASLIDRLFSTSVNKEVLHFLTLLIEKHRLDLLKDILTEYQNEMQTLLKSLQATVMSAFPLSEDEVTGIKSKLKKMYSVEEVSLSFEIDKNLLGGFQLLIGNTVIDSSIKGMMDKIKNQVISR